MAAKQGGERDLTRPRTPAEEAAQSLESNKDILGLEFSNEPTAETAERYLETIKSTILKDNPPSSKPNSSHFIRSVIVRQQGRKITVGIETQSGPDYYLTSYINLRPYMNKLKEINAGNEPRDISKDRVG